jgi:peptide-methionine (S)-S-oxide reductase
MSSSQPSRKHLPEKPSPENLKKQAKGLAKREHLRLADHKVKKPIDHARQGTTVDKKDIIELLDRPVIRDPVFKSAVKAIQTGSLAALKKLLAEHPNLVHDRAIEPDCYPPTYFSNPKLIWFVADNPNLIETMPTNTLKITQAIIDAGAERDDLNYTLELVATSRPAREQNLQRPLMELLMKAGARVTETAMYVTLGHWERDAVQTMLDAGQPMTAPIAAGMGRTEDLKQLLSAASEEMKYAALSMAVINRQLAAAEFCIDAGADVNRFLLVHSHSLPVHQAAVNDDVPMLKLLVERGAKLDIRDTLWNATPLGWAIHTKKPAAEVYLRSVHAP